MKHSLAKNFHENTKEITVNPNFDTNIAYKIYPNATAIPLAANSIDVSQGDSFLQTLLSRKSTRSFSGEGITLQDLSRLLSLSCGRRNDTARTYASAGARYPIETYVAIMQPCDIPQGIYHYNVQDNTLELIKKGDYSTQLKNFYKNQDTAITTDYPCLILFSAVFDRTMQKYNERGYRFIMLDAGHMSQNLYLVATYLNLGVVALGAGAGSDNVLDDMLSLDSSTENVFYTFAVGYPK